MRRTGIRLTLPTAPLTMTNSPKTKSPFWLDRLICPRTPNQRKSQLTTNIRMNFRRNVTTRDTAWWCSTSPMRPTTDLVSASICGKPGHQWRDCPEELKESLKATKEWLNRKTRQLNKNRGTGVKGGRTPQSAGHAKAPPAKPRK